MVDDKGGVELITRSSEVSETEMRGVRDRHRETEGRREERKKLKKEEEKERMKEGEKERKKERKERKN